MLKKILIVLAAVVALFAGYVASQPANYRVARSTVIAAPPAKVFAHVDDFHKWQDWSPWAKIDPNAKTSFEGPATGKGAVFKWSGNDAVGEGRMTLVDSAPPAAIRIKLDFVRPFADTANVAFDFAPEDGKTRVTWTMSGESGFIQRAICTLMGGMDRMIGADYETGLASLKAVVEGARG